MPGQLSCVHGAGPAEGDHHELAGVDAALDRDHADGGRHGGVGDVVDGPGGREHVEPEGRGDATSSPSRLDAGSRAMPPERRRAEVAEHQVGVGDRRFGAAPAVARRPGDRPRRAGTDAEGAARVDPRDAPAARADLGQVDTGILTG